MGLVLLAVLSLVVSASAFVEVANNYHDAVGIPEAIRIKEAEDAILAGDTTSNRIVGGSVAPANQYPYLGGLVISFVGFPGNSVCGSSLISDNRLVTAAHCWFDGNRQGSQFTVVLGSQFLFSGGVYRIPTSQVVMHPAYTPSTLGNDIAMIYLPFRIFFSNGVRAVNLPLSSMWDSFVGEWAWAAGYGRTSDQQLGVSTNTVVSHVQLPVIPVNQCQSVFGSVFVRPTTLCTSGFGGRGICGGDSGGPLVVNRNGQPTLIGVSSFVARAGCQLGHPSAFARVTSFINFIMQHM